MSSLKQAPVVIQLTPGDVQKADLMKELHVDKHQIGQELLRQPSKYGWWSSLHSEALAKVEMLEMREEELFSDLARHYLKKYKGIKPTNLKHHIVGNPGYQKLRRRLWRWKNSERILKGAVKSFEQRLNALQSYAADQRKERDSEPKVKRERSAS